MFNRSKAKAGGRRLRATGGVPGMLEVMLLAAALFMILVPPYLNDAMAHAGSDAAKQPVAAEIANASCEIRSAQLSREATEKRN